MNLLFPSQGSFLDPLLTSDGKPYGPARFKEIVKQRYFISTSINTSYNDLGKITPLERTYILEFIGDELKRSKEMAEQFKQERNRR